MSVSISLVIPAYNRAHLIGETIESALHQTRAFAEIIVVDDGSTDNTADVLSLYSNRIRVISTKNQGVQAARNKGIDAATSDYVALCDSDDLLESIFVETMSNWLVAHPDIDATYTNVNKFGGKVAEADHLSQAPKVFLAGAKTSKGFFYEIPDLYLRQCSVHYFYPTGATFKRSFYQELGGFDTRFKGFGAEDCEFSLRVAAAGRVAVCQTALGRVRRHDGNDSADELHMIVGKAQILEYALTHHPRAALYKSEIQSAVSSLRERAANDAFGRGHFELASRMFAHKHARKMRLKFNVKKTIVRFPEPIRTLLWKATQV